MTTPDHAQTPSTHRLRRHALLTGALLTCVLPLTVGCEKTAPQRQRVFFIEPADGATIKAKAADGLVPVAVKMGVEGMKVEAAGKVVENSGHHHIIVDADATPEGQAVPKDEQHIHYGKGQTETTLHLPPGKHTLKLQFANGAHISYGPKMSASIAITVEATGGTPAAKDAAPAKAAAPAEKAAPAKEEAPTAKAAAPEKGEAPAK